MFSIKRLTLGMLEFYVYAARRSTCHIAQLIQWLVEDDYLVVVNDDFSKSEGIPYATTDLGNTVLTSKVRDLTECRWQTQWTTHGSHRETRCFTRVYQAIDHFVTRGIVWRCIEPIDFDFELTDDYRHSVPACNCLALDRLRTIDSESLMDYEHMTHESMVYDAKHVVKFGFTDFNMYMIELVDQLNCYFEGFYRTELPGDIDGYMFHIMMQSYLLHKDLPEYILCHLTMETRERIHLGIRSIFQSPAGATIRAAIMGYIYIVSALLMNEAS